MDVRIVIVLVIVILIADLFSSARWREFGELQWIGCLSVLLLQIECESISASYLSYLPLIRRDSHMSGTKNQGRTERAGLFPRETTRNAG